MIRIRTSSFSDLKPSDLVSSAQKNVNAVLSHPEFEGISPSPSTVQNLITDLTAKIAIAANGSKNQKSERDLVKTALLSCLVQWSNFAMMKANAKPTEQEQIAVVNAAAFVPVIRGARIGSLSAISKIRTKSLSKAIFISWGAVPGAHSYKVMKTSGYGNEHSIWTEVDIVSRVRITVSCNPAEVMSFIIYPLGTAGRGPQSKIITCLAGL